MIVTGVPEGDTLVESQNDYHTMLTGVNVIEKNGYSYVRTVQSVKTLHQPSGLLFDLYLDNDGYVRNEQVAQGETLIIDIGEGTTDVSIFHDLRKTSGFSIKKGVSEVARQILGRIGSQIKAPITLADVQRTVRSESKTIVAGRESLDISQPIQEVKQMVVDNILSQIQSRVQNRDQFARVLVGGGGAGFFNDALLDWQGDAVVISDQTAIARGFRKFGLASARREGLV